MLDKQDKYFEYIFDVFPSLNDEKAGIFNGQKARQLINDQDFKTEWQTLKEKYGMLLLK